MMSRLPRQIVISLLLLIVTLVVVTARQGPLGPPEPIISDASPPRVALAERLAMVDAVARIHVIGKARVRAADTTDWLRRKIPGLSRSYRAVYPVTEWMVRVTEALKPRGRVATGAMIRLGAVGGRVTFDEREFLADGPHFQLVAGESYLIFLVFHEQLGMFVNSEFDVFNVDGPRARAAGRRTQETPYGKQLVGEPSEAVIRSVREALRR